MTGVFRGYAKFPGVGIRAMPVVCRSFDLIHLPFNKILPAWLAKNPAVVGQSFGTERLGFSLTSRLATPLDWPSHHTRPEPPVFFFHPESAEEDHGYGYGYSERKGRRRPGRFVSAVL